MFGGEAKDYRIRYILSAEDQEIRAILVNLQESTEADKPAFKSITSMTAPRGTEGQIACLANMVETFNSDIP